MKTVPDTRVPCGVNGKCVDLKEPWHIGCPRHMEMLPPGIRRLINNDTTSSHQSLVNTTALDYAKKVWRGEELGIVAPVVVHTPINASFMRSNPHDRVRRISSHIEANRKAPA